MVLATTLGLWIASNLVSLQFSKCKFDTPTFGWPLAGKLDLSGEPGVQSKLARLKRTKQAAGLSCLTRFSEQGIRLQWQAMWQV
jgi:hypothetical protein